MQKSGRLIRYTTLTVECDSSLYTKMHGNHPIHILILFSERLLDPSAKLIKAETKQGNHH
jgi:hypothetical protein